MTRVYAMAVWVGLLSLTLWQTGAAPATTQSALGQRVAAYCRDRKGQQVGDGQCAALAYHAIKENGGRKRGKDSPEAGDYVWGDLVLLVEGDPKSAKFSNGKTSDLRPGDILQFRSTAFETKDGKRTKSYRFGHHTAVLASAQGATMQIWQQNFRNEKTVTTLALRMTDLKEGWVRFYRPIPRGDDQSTDEAPKDTSPADTSDEK